MRAQIHQPVGSVVKATALALLAAAPAHAAGGLQLIPDLPFLGLMIVVFVLLIFPLNALIFKPLLGVLDQRNERIAGSRKRANQLETEADEVLGRYETALREVREEAEQGRRGELDAARADQAQLTAAARAEANSELEQARSEISSAFEEARATLRAQTDALAKDIATQVLGRPLS